MVAWVTSEAYRLMISALVAARVDASIGQRELARRLGRPPSWLNKIERLERRLDILEFAAIARAIGLSPAELMAKVSADLPTPLAL